MREIGATDPRQWRRCAAATGRRSAWRRRASCAIVMAALMLGLLLMGIQLWLLTVALELYLGGHGRQVWLLALVSGLIFAGGLLDAARAAAPRPR